MIPAIKIEGKGKRGCKEKEKEEKRKNNKQNR
jgi:hypothetical protein